MSHRWQPPRCPAPHIGVKLRTQVCKILLAIAAALTFFSLIQLGNQVTQPFTAVNFAKGAIGVLTLAILVSGVPQFLMAVLMDTLRQRRRQQYAWPSQSRYCPPNRYGPLSEPTDQDLREIARITDRQYRRQAS